MASPSRSSQPTIRERLNAAPGLNPAIRPSSIYTYDEARPGYVERDHFAGNEMGRLARSLAAIDSSLIPVMEKYQDRKIEEAITKGGELFAQNEALDKNRTNWKDYIEANPQHSPYNPYLQIGYEKARLKSLAMDQNKAMEDAFVQSGMVNERDQGKVNKWIQEFCQGYRKDNHLDSYEDRLTLAEAYSAEEFKSRASLLNKHSHYLQSQNEALAMQQFSELALKEIEAAFDPTRGGSLFGDPATSQQDMQKLVGIIGTRTQEALNNGVLNANAGDMIFKTVLSAYEHLGRNPNVLKALDHIKTPDGVTISALPGVAEKLHNLEQARIEERRSSERHWWAQQDHARKMEKEYWTGEGLMKWDTGAPPTPENMDKLGVPKRLQPLFAADVNKWHQAQYTGRKDAPAYQRQLSAFQIMADFGEWTNEELTELAPQFGREYVEDLYNRNSKAKKEEETTFTSALKDAGNKAYSMFSRDKKDLMDALQSVSFGFSSGLTKEQQIGLEAAQLAHAKMQMARSEFVAKNNKAPSQEYLISLQPRILTEVQAEISARYVKGNSGDHRDSNGIYVPPASAVKEQPQQRPSLARSTPPAHTAIPAAVDPLNTLVSSWIEQQGLDIDGATMHMTPEEKTRWVSTMYPARAAELASIIRSNLSKR